MGIYFKIVVKNENPIQRIESIMDYGNVACQEIVNPIQRIESHYTVLLV